MSLSKDILFREIINLEPVQAMQATVNSAIKYGTIVGAATIISGILGGPKALTVGGIIGSCIAGYLTSETLKSVPYILRYETTPEQRERLVQLVRDYLTPNNIYTLGDFIHSVTTSPAFMGVIIQIVIFFLSEIGYNCF